MRILITNDDGIDAPGLVAAEKIARALDPAAEFWVVAPLNERSGVAHCISYVSPARIEQRGERRYAIDGYPADCVLAAVHHLMDGPPDVILSGVNRGNNAAENSLYSGTIGAAMEGALQGLRAVALSQYYGPANRDLDDSFDAAVEHGAEVVRRLLDKGQWGGTDYHLFYNVNFPPCPAADVKGTQIVRQGMRDGVRFSALPTDAPNGRKFLWMRGGDQQAQCAPGTDAAANLAGYVSVTPMRADLTDHQMLDALHGIF